MKLTHISLDNLMAKLQMNSRQAVRAYLNMIEGLTGKAGKNSYFFEYEKGISIRRIKGDKEVIKNLVKLNKLRTKDKASFYALITELKNTKV